MRLDTQSGFWVCPNQHRVPETLEEAQTRMKAKGAPPSVTITYRGSLEARTKSVFETAHYYLWQGDKPHAIETLKQAADLQPDFIDAYLWLAKLCDDDTQKHHYLDDVLARDPGHIEALRLLMVLNGDMTPEEAELSMQAADPKRVHADGAVRAVTQTLICPVCGGGLTVDEASGRVVCKFCGYLAPLAKRSDREGGTTLGVALLKRRAQAVQWVIGERLLHCQQCGTERTIPAGRLSQVCPFCGANAVIESDALKTVEKPDTLLPFTVNEEQAKLAIRERLNKLDQRMAGLLDDNRVARAVIEGLFVPLWVFDALVNVSQTTTNLRLPNSRDQVRTFKPYENIQFQDGMVGVPIFGMKQPPILKQISEYDLSPAQAYDPKLLARTPAALYDVDFDAASLTARSHITQTMRERYERGGSGQSLDVKVYANVLQMTFTLLLVPVWIATLYERDGEIRAAVVNGQTGAVALGDSRKP